MKAILAFSILSFVVLRLSAVEMDPNGPSYDQMLSCNADQSICMVIPKEAKEHEDLQLDVPQSNMLYNMLYYDDLMAEADGNLQDLLNRNQLEYSISQVARDQIQVAKSKQNILASPAKFDPNKSQNSPNQENR